ncbi:hypothetical protein BO79DRAFT_230259 [Aspergillus costaricaensis CBS 115574]|uniref:Uncharacterized protein n=1 Tax=Aspergillus costaricaensis CBS 115574 TaxID=1448317 RepID=A0ACD1I8J8_9EURO|nr:hypothetical protein BO79DRAFT_230259 [Aspergillus costaricaensis CBS 115574]RAK86603.1 hypothetical protein BO79DRAFT_230259 [Aspergillus costaricaensis CBS 115574]
MKLAWEECAYGQAALDSGWPRRECLIILSSRPISIAVCTLWPGQVGATNISSAVCYTHTCQEAKATQRHLGDRNSNTRTGRCIPTSTTIQRPDSLGVVEFDTSILRSFVVTSLAMRDWGLAPPSGRMLNLSVLLPATTNVRDLSSRIPLEESPTGEEGGGRKRSQKEGTTNQQTHEQEVGHWRGVTGWSKLNQMDHSFPGPRSGFLDFFFRSPLPWANRPPLEVN